MSGPQSENGDDRSILRELVFNQYQAIVLAGVVAVSALSASPLPLLVWGGGQLVLLPALDSRPLRRWVARRRRTRERAASEASRTQAREALQPAYARRYEGILNLCSQIEANYQQLHGLSQAYLVEQQGKLNLISDGCLRRLLALQRYEALLERRPASAVQQQIKSLERDVERPDLPDRARLAVQKNIELKQQLLKALEEARATMTVLVTELDSMASLLEVLHQNSIAMRDPEAVSQELDAIARQSEDSGRVVREMEALVRAGGSDWGEVQRTNGGAENAAAAARRRTGRRSQRTR